MIQRKQSLYLLASFFLIMFCLCTQIGSYESEGMIMGKIYNLWITDSAGNHHYTMWPLMLILLFAGTVSVSAIFLYHKRLLQATLCVVGMFLLVAWYIVFVVLAGQGVSLTLSTALPCVSALFLFLARRAILADEKLVKSMDRLR